jgi:hypothetical protein
MLLYLLLFLLVGICMVSLPIVLWGRSIYRSFSGARAVTCPETKQTVAVELDAVHAAVTGLRGKPDLRLADCTRWPEKAGCNEACLEEACQTAAYIKGEVAPPKTKNIYHLPVALAAVAAWVLGLVWHSEYLFRTRWLEALGASEPVYRRVVEWLAPHLLSFGVPLLFAYGVAWLLSVRRQWGVRRGMLAGVFLWSALALAALLGTEVAGLPRDLLWIEVLYTVIASVMVGAIIGGLSGKMTEERLQPMAKHPAA